MILRFSLCILFSGILCFGQKNPEAVKVTYSRTSNGKLLTELPEAIVWASKTASVNTNSAIESGKAAKPFEKYFTDTQNQTYLQLGFLPDGNVISTLDSLLARKEFRMLEGRKKILGYECRKASTVVNSNTYEFWFTDAFGIKAGPFVLGQHLGLVLEVVRNGNYVLLATSVKKLKSVPAELSKPVSKNVDGLTYADLLWKSRFTTIPLFKNELVRFSDEAKSNDSIQRFGGGTILLRKIKIPEITPGSQVFIDLTQQSNGDGYDRTGSVFLIPTDSKKSFLDGLKSGISALPVYDNGNGKQYQGVARTDDYTPLLEVMRFFTPFGIKAFNDFKLKNKTWQDSAYYRQDISELSSAISGKEAYVGLFLGNYDKGGHRISASVTIHPEKARKPELFVLPLFNTVNVMEMASQEYGTMFSSEKGLEVAFNLPKKLRNSRLRYIATGHGGWENGDEYVPKKNSLFLDGNPVFAFTPWRSDCGSLRLYSPISGNFENGLSSSDYSRANWCPGAVTDPVFIDLGDLEAGRHTIKITIPMGQPEGPSFSHWNVSGAIIGE